MTTTSPDAGPVGAAASEPTAHGGLIVRVLVASALLMLIVGGTFALLLRAVAAERNAVALSLQSHEVLASANRLQRLLVDLETGARGYLLTGEERFLQPWTAARAAIPAETAHLRRLTEVPVQNGRADEVAELIESYVDSYSVPLVDAARRGDPGARSVATTAEGKSRVDEIRDVFAALEATEQDLARTRDANAANRSRQSVGVAAAGLGLSVLVTVLLATYLTRAIVRPVRRAAHMADRLAGGDLSARVPETAVGEIGLLERSFNEMGTSLERNREDLDRLLEEQAALRRVATLVAHGVAPSIVFSSVTEEAGVVLGVDGTRLLRREPDGTATIVAAWGAGSEQIPIGERASLAGHNVTAEVLRTGRIAWSDAFSGPEGSIGAAMNELGIRLGVGAPIVIEGQVWGAMVAISMQARSPAQIEQPLAQFTDLVATAIANTQARADLAASRARLVTAGDEARRRIERDLHDGIQQRLVSLSLDLRGVEAGVPEDLPEVRQQLSELAGGLTSTLDDLREVARGIHPAILSEGGLGPALKALARRSAVPVDLDLRLATRPPAPVEVAAYYAVAEALTNVAKHARADEVRIGAATLDDRLEISVVDDGRGGADPAGGSGLAGLNDRIEALGGRLIIDSRVGEGTEVQIRLPLHTG